MKAPFRKALLRGAFVILLTVVAYRIGWLNGIGPTKAAIATPTRKAQLIPSDSPATTDTESPDRLTPEQVLRRELEKLDQLIKLSPSSDRDALVEMQFLTLVYLDPATAFSKIGLIADQDKRHEIADRILGIWLFTDTNQGLAELAKLPRGKQTQSDYLHAFQTWAGLNPNAPPWQQQQP